MQCEDIHHVNGDTSTYTKYTMYNINTAPAVGVVAAADVRRSHGMKLNDGFWNWRQNTDIMIQNNLMQG